MNQNERKEVRIFNAALELPAAERAAWLDQACAGDAVLRRQVEALLQACGEAEDFFKTALDPQPRPPGPPTVVVPLTEKPGDRIGRYKLLQQIGEGGCGVVFMAEQEEPVRRRVALKVIKLGMDTRQVVARFEAERQALALMDHPNIAKVLDAGATDTGRPYFVMELVRGVRLTQFCEENHLTLRQRLDLFVLVCHAVQHAHQKGIIHRDLKPSNILVTVNDGVPVPKVIDFGIAKATTGQRLTDKTLFTAFEQFMGTPAYMSPEQAVLTSLDIDTRSDIYSLGVLLYEMLTGKTPFDAKELWEAGMDEMRRTIREVEPVKPSTRLTLERLATSSAGSGKPQIQNLKSEIAQDLDWIVMKALEKDRTRRYATSLDFAADIQRHLDHEPVHAGAPSQLYKFQKLIRRNKGAFAAAAAVFLALLTGLGLTAWQAVRASRAEHAARSAAQAASTDRDRAVLAESNATGNATAATNALLTANERMVKLNVAEGWRRVEEGDHFGALLPFAEAFALEQDKPDRAEIHQMRLASVLQHCPKLVNVWSVGTNINHAEFSRDGSKLLISTTSDEGFDSETQTWVQVFASSTGRALTVPMQHRHRITSVLWSDDETRIVSASHDETVKVWDAATGHLVGKPLVHGGPVIRARFSGDGAKVLALGVISTRFDGDDQDWFYGAGLHLWDVRNSGLVWSNCIPDPAPMKNPVLLSPDGQKVVSAYDLFDAHAGKLLSGSYRESHGLPPPPYLGGGYANSSGHTGGDCDSMAHASEFSPDGRRLFIGGTLRDGKTVERIIKRWPEQGEPQWVRFSRDGSKLATANESATTRIWNAEDGSPLTSPMEHGDAVSDLSFGLDGAWLATGTVEGDARIWDAATGKPITPRLPHESRVLRVAFSGDGKQLLVACANGSVAVWNIETMDMPRFTWSVPNVACIHRPHGYQVSYRSSQISSDGRFLLTQTDKNPTATAWSLLDGDPILPPTPVHGSISAVGSNVIIRNYSTWTAMSLKDGSKVTHSASNHFNYSGWIWTGQLSGDGQQIVFGHHKGQELLIFDAPSGELTSRLDCPLPTASFPLIRPDGQQAVVTVRGGQMVHWDLTSPAEPKVLQTDYWRPADYSPGGRWLRLVHEGPENWSYGGSKLFDSRTFQEAFSDGDNDWYLHDISPDDTWAIMENAGTGAYRIQCLTNIANASSVLRHRGYSHASAFTSDSKLIVTAGSDLALRFWSVPSGERMLLPMTVPASVKNKGILISGDGRGFVTVHDDDTVRFWELPKGQRPVSEWLALARFFAKGRGAEGRSADFQSAVSPTSSRQSAAVTSTPETTTNAPDRTTPGGLETRDTADWKSALPSFHAQWLALRTKHPEVFTVSADEIDAWHRHEAWRCESRQDWSNAVAHLSALLETHPDSGDFLPRRAAACVAWAESLLSLAPGFNPVSAKGATTSAASAASRPPEAVQTAPALAAQNTGLKPGANETVMTSRVAATNHLERALADYARTLAWVDRFPAIAKESRKPFVEKRREVYLKLGRKAEAEADERELKAGSTPPTQP